MSILKKIVVHLHLQPLDPIIVTSALTVPKGFLDRPAYGYTHILIREKNHLYAQKKVVVVGSVFKAT
jgi:hypothetical protein